MVNNRDRKPFAASCFQSQPSSKINVALSLTIQSSRGNTAKQIVRLIKQAGAKEVTLVSSCPPINNPCYYGIDFPSAAELVAHNKTEEEVAADLGCDRVVFQTVEGLKDALEQASLCTGCLTDTYPTDY